MMLVLPRARAWAKGIGRGLMVFITLGLCWVPAQAHLMPAQQGSVNLKGNAAYVALSVPVSALHGFDDDQDHRLSVAELQRHQDSLREQVDAHLWVSSAQGAAQTVRVDVMLSPGHDDQPDVSDQLLVLKHARFREVPDTLTVHNGLWGTDGTGQRITLKASRGDETEAAQLTADRPAFVFFRTRWQALWDHTVMGAEHVLMGADHLLFLLTIGVIGAGWRYGLKVITAFTVAHSVTLGLGTLGWAHASPDWVEPMIAASIVIMAWDNLRRTQRAPWQRIALVFACGLLHGLGFASAMTDLGLDSRHLVISLVGFNLGIELGQLMFLSTAAILWWVVRRWWPGLHRQRLAQLLSALAMVTGLYWLVERTLA